MLAQSFVITPTYPVSMLYNITQIANFMLITILITLYYYFKLCVKSSVFRRGHWYFGRCALSIPKELTTPVRVTSPFYRLHQGNFWLCEADKSIFRKVMASLVDWL